MDKRETNELSYFKLRLQELINTSFPELAHNGTFINQRSNLAADTYEQAFRVGNQPEHCQAIADSVLFEGLYFSRFDTVFQVVCNEFDTIMADEELRPFALKMFPICEPVFSNYQLTDDFAYTIEYNFLYTEITGIITLWIEDNGLQ